MSRPTAVTRAHPFRRVGGDEGSPNLLQVSAGVPAHASLSLAECLLCHLRARCSDAVGGEPIAGDEAYACELLLDPARGERPVVWFSTMALWEPSAAKGIECPHTRRARRATLAEMEAVGLARVVADAADLTPWPALAAVTGARSR